LASLPYSNVNLIEGEKMSKIIVTGANGFLGWVLVNKFQKEGKNVLAFLKTGEDTRLFEELRIPWVYGNVVDKNSFDRFVEEGDTIIHLAAIVSISEKDREIVWKVNFEGTQNVLESALEKKASRFVYVSSVHAIPFHDGTITEEDVWAQDGEPLGTYEKSKRAATKLVLKTKGENLKTIVIFPSGIMGPGDEKIGEVSTLIKQVANNSLPAYISGGYAFCDVRDVVTVIDKTLEEGAEGSFLVSGGYLSIKEIIDMTINKTSAKRNPVWIPRFLAWSFLPFISAVQRLSKKKPLFTSYSLKVTKDKPIFSTAKAEKLLGLPLIQPILSLIDEIEYLKKQGVFENHKKKAIDRNHLVNSSK
jgi:dihydroflavonol-4-reductase